MTDTIDIGDGALLRQVAETDADALYAVVAANREHLLPWMPWAAEDRDGTASFLHDAVARAAAREAVSYLIVEHHVIVGTVGMHHTDWLNRATSMGYWLAAGAQGRGLVTRAVSALLDRCFGEAEMHRVEIRTNPANARSRAVVERLGFVEEGTARGAERHADGYRDLIVYSMLADDWRR
jgi:ribosomal-protein-serine acetyltransferase